MVIVSFLLLSPSAHALMDKEGSDCHHSSVGLNSIRTAFQKWEYGRKNPETYRELAPKALIEHYRSWQEYNKLPDHIRDDRAAQAMISTFRRWNEAR
ncbi:hypothetical protein GV64_24400 [Endozoicomonas elysicola]|uniref:Uncharacterized protein n=2 Tax=Endozoicomonas elysicola TaxID=305900 RepID=A0A081KH19_9GAMM|nr:hypothetical protein GV64_24400 [Endozoicomonas elysicola]